MPSTLVESPKVARCIVLSSILVPLSSSSLNLIATVAESVFTTGPVSEEKTSRIMQEHTSLSLEEYRRYGRQMILRGFGLPGKSTVSQITYRGSQTNF